jgi:bifunctional DNase/RNase
MLVFLEGVGMREVNIDSIRMSLMSYQRVVVLKEKSADRYLPIWIGPAEAEAIAIQLQQMAVQRPLTHDLLRSIIQALGATVQSVIVHDLANETFFARIVLDISGRSLEIDSRPSDALALAVRVKVPIFVEESVLDKAGVMPDQDGKLTSRTAEPQAQELTEEELKRLAPFRDFIQSLDLDDLGGSGQTRRT